MPPDSAPEAASPAPLAAIEVEARRLLASGAQAGIELRLLGGLAISFHIPQGHGSLLPRAYKDIDLVTTKAHGRAVRAHVEQSGYEPDVQFNSLHGHRRLLFYDRVHERQVDVFVDEFEMCHRIPVAERLAVQADTVPLAELLLTKLQIYELNEKDQVDILNLLCYREVGSTDAGEINADVVAALCARDWGLWRTTKLNVERTSAALERYGLQQPQRDRIADRLTRLWSRIEQEKKSRAWRLRARVGDRVRWYEEPEEVG